MVYEVNKPMSIDAFADAMDAIFTSRGMQFSKQLMGDEGTPWYRYSMRPQSTQLSPLVLDLSPGPSIGEFGHAVEVRSQKSEKHALMGAEVFYGETASSRGQPHTDLRTPFENLGHYVQQAGQQAATSPVFDRSTMHENFWTFMTLGSSERRIAGSVARAGGESDPFLLKQDVARSVSVGFGPSVQDTTKGYHDIYGLINAPSGGTESQRLWGALRGYGFFSETSDVSGLTVTRLRQAGIPTSMGNILGIGAQEQDLIKRRAVTMGFGGTRQQGFVYDVDPRDPTRLVEKEAGYITDPTARGGYKFSNILYPGETQPRVTTVRPGTEFRSGTLFPGAMLQYQDPYAGSYGLMYKSKIDISLPSQNVPDYATREAKFEWGLDWTDKGAGSPLAGGVVPAGKSVKIGQYTLPGKEAGAVPITEDIFYRAGGRAVHFRGEPRLHFTQAYHTAGEFARLPHSGVTPEGKLPPHVTNLSPAQRRMIMEGAGGNVDFTSQMDVFITIPSAIEVSESVKSAGVKAGTIIPGGLELIPQQLLTRETESGHRIPISGSTAGLKADLPRFVGMFGSMTNPQQHRVVQQAFPGPTGQALAGYIQGQVESTDAPAAAIPLIGLAQTAYQAGGGEGEIGPEALMRFYEDFRQSFQNRLSAEQRAEYGEQYFGKTFGEPWIATPAEYRNLRSEAMLVYSGGGPRSEVTGAQALAARRQFRENISAEELAGGNYLVQSLAETMVGTLAHTPIPEFFGSKPTKFGIDERAAITASFPQVANFMGLGVGQDPYATGYRPPHQQAWDRLSETYGVNRENTQLANIRGSVRRRVPHSVELTEERQDALGIAIAEGATQNELAALTRSWGQGPLYRSDMPAGQEYLDQPGDIGAVAQHEYGAAGGEAIDRISRLYPRALESFTTGSSDGIKEYQYAKQLAISSKAGTITKGRGASFLAQGQSVRYSGVSGVSPGTGIIEEQRLVNMFREMAGASDMPYTPKLEGKWMAQAKEQMRSQNLAGIGIRYPVLGQSTGAVMQSLMTPDVAEEVFGISQARASRIAASGEIIPGSVGASAGMKVGPSFFKRTIGDLDRDPMAMFPVFKVGGEGDLEFAGQDQLQQMLSMGAGQRVEQENQVLRSLVGGAGSMQFNEFAGAISELGSGSLKGYGGTPGLVESGFGDMFSRSIGAMKSKQGMGVSYNLRRLLTASAESLGVGTEGDIARGHTGGALSYQRYLDSVANATQGFSMTEQLMQTMYVSGQKRRPEFGAALGRDAEGELNWVKLSKYNADPDIQKANINMLMGGAMRRAISSDLGSGHMNPIQAALLLSQKGVLTPQEAEAGLTGPSTTAEYSDAIRGLTRREGFDWGQTVLGTAAYAELGRKALTKTMKDPAGATVKISDEVGSIGVPYGQMNVPLSQLTKVPAIESTLALRKQYRGTEGTLLPSEVEAVMRAGGAGGGGYSMAAVMSAYEGGRDPGRDTWHAPEPIRVPNIPQSVNTQYVARGGAPLYNRESGMIRKYTAAEGARPSSVGAGGVPPFIGGGGGVAPPGGADPSGDPSQWSVSHLHLGLSRLPQKSMQVYAAGIGAYQRMFGDSSGLGKVTSRIQQMVESTQGEAFNPNWFQALGELGADEAGLGYNRLEAQISKAFTADPRGTSQLFTNLKGTIRTGIRGATALDKASQEMYKHGDILSGPALDLLGATGISSGDIDEASAGRGRQGVEANLFRILDKIGKEKGLFGKQGAVPTEAEEARIDVTSRASSKKLTAFLDELEKSKKVIGSEREERLKGIAVMKKEREFDLAEVARKQALLSPVISSLRDELAMREEAGADPQELGMIREQLMGAEAQRGALAGRESKLLAQDRGRGFGSTLKSLTGGWNVMYMQRMLQLGMGKFQEGYQESQAYQMQMGQAGRAIFGGEMPGFASPDLAYQRAMLRRGGTVMAGMRHLQAQAPSGLSDLAGTALTGIGTMSLSTFIGSTLEAGGGPLGLFGGGISAAALPIGAAITAGGLIATQAAYAGDPDQGVVSRAAVSMGRGDDNFFSAAGDVYRLAGASMRGGVVRDSFANIAGWMTGQHSLAEMKRKNEQVWEDTPIAQKEKYEGAGRAIMAGKTGATSGFSNKDIMMTAMAMSQQPGGYTGVLTAEVETPLIAKGLQAGMSGDELKNYVEQTGMAQQGGVDVGGMAQMEAAIRGIGPLSGLALRQTEARYAQMSEPQQRESAMVQDLMGRTPGMQRITQGLSDDQYQNLMGRYGGIAPGANEELFLQQMSIREQQIQLGMRGQEVRPEDYQQDRIYGRSQLEQITAANMLAGQQMGVQSQLLGMGVTGYGGFVGGMDTGQVRGLQSALQMNPTVLTQMAQAGAISNRFAIGDIGMDGQLTGQAWGTTSLTTGSMSAVQAGIEMFGGQLAASDAAGAAMFGVEDPAGNRWGGMRGIQWQRTYTQRGFADRNEALNREGIGLQAGYLQNMWEVQDRQRALQHEQRLWGFEQQDRQFQMQGTQWEEQRGLARRGQLQQRGWQQQDWAMQDTQVALQWQWQQEDFAENIRFMSGRQRRIAERTMERKTTMHGLSETQRDRQEERQKTLWALADERFEMEREHWENNRELIEENMEKQKEFYDEGKKLQDEMIIAQREYQLAQIGLQEDRLELQEEQRVAMEELQDVQRILNETQQDRISILQAEAVLDPAGIFEAIVKAYRELLNMSVNITQGDWLDSREGRQLGGDMIPGGNYLLGEVEPEMVRPGTIGSVVTPSDLRSAKRLYHDRWDDTTVMSDGSAGGSGGKQSITVYIGNKKIKDFIVETISDELEVH